LLTYSSAFAAHFRRHLAVDTRFVPEVICSLVRDVLLLIHVNLRILPVYCASSSDQDGEC
jgi:hypothetical protein